MPNNQTTSPTIIERLRQKVEWQVLELIRRLTEIGKMTQDHAQNLAKHALDCIRPGMQPEEFFKGVVKLDDGYPETSFIVVPIAKKYHDQIELPTIEHIRHLIRNAHYDSAVDMAKRLVSQDIKIKMTATGRPKKSPPPNLPNHSNSPQKKGGK